ncbi:MAG: fasciclin domain-containing protein, partial [Alistipes sp.]|nr:fasciclin domain-containing protein [Alistipes sp.]
MKQIKWIVCLLAAALISSCDSLVENYKFDTEGFGTKDWDIIDYCESEVAYQMGSYGKAMRLAGMEDVLAQGNLTCVIPSDDAFAAFVNEAGYESFDEVPAAVWRDLLMYLIFPGEHYCLNMEPGEVRTVNSLRGEPISIMRSENEKSYAMSINGENDLPKIAVESQDYRFKNNIVGQLVKIMPY